jgi:hypothetical protein
MKSIETSHARRLPSYYTQDLAHINFRAHPELYRVGKGEQGVLMVEPYKSEILPFWQFKNPEVAAKSSEKIYDMFLEYLQIHDFVGADMARKFYKWVIHVPGVMQIINLARNMLEIHSMKLLQKLSREHV